MFNKQISSTHRHSLTWCRKFSIREDKTQICSPKTKTSLVKKPSGPKIRFSSPRHFKRSRSPSKKLQKRKPSKVVKTNQNVSTRSRSPSAKIVIKSDFHSSKAVGTCKKRSSLHASSRSPSKARFLRQKVRFYVFWNSSKAVETHRKPSKVAKTLAVAVTLKVRFCLQKRCRKVQNDRRRKVQNDRRRKVQNDRRQKRSSLQNLSRASSFK